MSDAARAELVSAIEADEIDNAAEYAEAFAARHRLNPVSVRSAISRLRRDLGKPKRGVRSGEEEKAAEARQRINAVTLLKLEDATDQHLTRVAAAALIRYEHDEAFRHAVDEQRPGIERIYESLASLRRTTPGLLPDEREALERFFAPD